MRDAAKRQTDLLHAAAFELERGRDRYERDLPLLSRVRESYRRQAVRHDWIVIDGEQSPDIVTAAVEQAVLSRIARR